MTQQTHQTQSLRITSIDPLTFFTGVKHPERNLLRAVEASHMTQPWQCQASESTENSYLFGAENQDDDNAIDEPSIDEGVEAQSSSELQLATEPATSTYEDL